MHFSNIAAVSRPRRTFFRTVAVCAVLSSPWSIATAAPVISGAPAASVVAAHYYAFQPGATDSAGKTLTFSIANKPSWAQFNTATGRLYGTPLPANVGKFANVAISVSDGSARASLAPFTITVLPLLNSPPVISGAPAGSVVVGKTYTFQPTATDPNGLKLGFAIVNRPSWATFDSTTGRLTGTPSSANAGTYSNIVITVYDGYMKGTLSAFSIVVQPAAATSTPVVTTTVGSATLSWVPPTANSDGTVLTNLAGYRIYYGTTSQLGQSVTVANPGLTRYVLSGLAANTWYFAMSAYNSAGVESARTAVESMIVQ